MSLKNSFTISDIETDDEQTDEQTNEYDRVSPADDHFLDDEESTEEMPETNVETGEPVETGETVVEAIKLPIESLPDDFLDDDAGFDDIVAPSAKKTTVAPKKAVAKPESTKTTVATTKAVAKPELTKTSIVPAKTTYPAKTTSPITTPSTRSYFVSVKSVSSTPDKTTPKTYLVEGLGRFVIDPAHLPSVCKYMKKVQLLDLYIVKVFDNPDMWIQKNYKSGKTRVIIDCAEGEYELEDIDVAKGYSEYAKGISALEKAQEIIDLQIKLVKIWN
uniref:Uncharacterized protein n=1 Tax=viral metagenome TaxID=1070528 RepID=A0A6C0JRD5_9ZZZZ